MWDEEEATEATEEEEEEDEEEPGVSDQKQKPHTKMWGKILYFTMKPVHTMREVANQLHIMYHICNPIYYGHYIYIYIHIIRYDMYTYVEMITYQSIS